MPFYSRYTNRIILDILNRQVVSDKPRVYAYKEYLTTTTTSSTTDVTVSNATLTFTPDASSNYVYFWSCDISANAGVDVTVSIKNTAGTVINQTNWRPEAIDDWNTLTGMSFETFGASPSSQSITFNFKISSASFVASIRNMKLMALKLTAADQYAFTNDEITNSTGVNGNDSRQRLTFTPASTGGYLIITSSEIATTSTTENALVNRLLLNGTQKFSYFSSGRLDNYLSMTTLHYEPSLSTSSQNVQFNAVTGRNTFAIASRRTRLLALRVDEFGTTTAVTTNNDVASTTSASYVTARGTGNLTTTDGLSYLVFGSCERFSNSDSVSVGQGLSIDGKYYAESFAEEIQLSTFGTEYMSPAIFTSFAVVTPGSSLFANIDIKAETTSANSAVDTFTFAALVL